MLRYFVSFIFFFGTINGDLWMKSSKPEGATLKPLSACCDIPELGDSGPLSKCTELKLTGPCDDVQCVFEESGFLTNKETINKEAYKEHLQKWLKAHPGWDEAIAKTIQDCVDKDIRQYLDDPCKAYDVFTCTGIAMLKKCPANSWKCGHVNVKKS